jgi:hypothetical protein
MENVFSSDFWSDQMACALKAWAIFVPFFLTFFAAFKIRVAKLKKKIRELRAHGDALDARLQLAAETNAGEAKSLDEIRTDIAQLRKLIEAKAEPSVVEPIIEDVDASASAQVTSNRTTNHILTAEKVAIGGTRRQPRRDSHENQLVSPAFMISISVAAFALFALLAISTQEPDAIQPTTEFSAR